MLRVVDMRLRGLSSRARSPADFRRDDVRADGMIFLRSAGVASVVYAPLARITSRRGDGAI